MHNSTHPKMLLVKGSEHFVGGGWVWVGGGVVAGWECGTSFYLSVCFKFSTIRILPHNGTKL